MSPNVRLNVRRLVLDQQLVQLALALAPAPTLTLTLSLSLALALPLPLTRTSISSLCSSPASRASAEARRTW